MNQQPAASAILVLFVPFLVIMLLAGLVWLPRYTGLARGKAVLAILGSAVVGGIIGFNIVRESSAFVRSSRQDGEVTVRIIAAECCIVLATAFALRLWGRWIGGQATDAERLPGVPGVCAWFSTANVVVGVLLIITAWMGFDISPLLSALVLGALLAAQPLIRMETSAPAALAAAPVPVDHSTEREKIFAMLEAGKLTPDESAELLQALGSSARAPAPSVPLSSGQRLLLIGAALVALGFFLPWFVINPGKEASRMMSQMQSSMRSSFGGNIEMPAGFPGMGNAQLKTGTVSISGGDIQRGLGWAALLLAGAAAFLPYVATALDHATARTIRLLCLGIGAIIVLYLLTQNIRFVGIGLILAVAGYALQIAGAVREQRAPRV